MPPINYDSVTFEIGDLVRFIGLSYTPDYYVPAEEPEVMGIIIDVVAVKGKYITCGWVYRVYWFSAGSITETVGGHMQLATV
jgi:hypothetical protein